MPHAAPLARRPGRPTSGPPHRRHGRRHVDWLARRLPERPHGETEGDGSPRAPAPNLDDVRSLVARVGQAGLPTTVAVHGPPLVVTPGVGLAAYRIVQEALTNCLKHSGGDLTIGDRPEGGFRVRATFPLAATP